MTPIRQRNPLVHRDNWLKSLDWQADFYRRSGPAPRVDSEFDWDFFEQGRGDVGPFSTIRSFSVKVLLKLGLRPRPSLSLDWIREHAALLWDTREMLVDDVSKMLFDSALVLRLTSHRRFYFPRIDFDDLLEILDEVSFIDDDFPHDYLGVPLGVFNVRILGRDNAPTVRIITRAMQLHLVNSYRQYLVRREGFDISPGAGDVVYDCGACIGEISMLFAGLVAPAGEVHLFDPMPLHTRFCELQARMNPKIASLLHINMCAVGSRSHEGHGVLAKSDRIIPGAVSSDDFACTTLDDYAGSRSGRVDFIKMDIEGAEIEALTGATRLIREFKPRLAISGYHKPQDLWEIPRKIKTLNPSYRIMFGHHTPIMWESVFYAVDESAFARARF